MNHIALLGQLGQAPELRYTQDGQPVTRVLLLVERAEGEGQDPIRVIARRELAESLVHEVKKGDLAVVEGRLLMRTYVSREGHRHKVAEVEAERLQRVAPAPSGAI